MNHTPRRAVLAVALSVLCAGLGAAGAGAADAPVPATVSSIKVTPSAFSGVLTVRSDGVAPTTSTLRVTVGGKEYPVTATPVPQGKRATMLVVDTSGSMGEAGMQTVREATAAFLKAAPKDVAVGLVSFAGTAGVDVAPTLDRARVQKAVNSLRSRGETSLYDAVIVGASALGAYSDRSLLLLSDGGDTRSKATRAAATAAVKNRGVRAEIIGFKTDDSDNSVLKGFAQAGGGSVAAAGNTASVSKAFATAAKALDSQVSFTVKASGLGGQQPVVVTGLAGARSFRADSTVDFGAAAPAPAPTPQETATVAPDNQAAATPTVAVPKLPNRVLLGAAVGALGLVVLTLVLMLPTAADRRRERTATIERYVTPGGAPVPVESSSSPSAISAQLIGIGDRVMDGRESTGKTMAHIERADLPLRAGEWWVLRLVALVAGTALGVMLFNGGVWMNIFGIVLGFLVGYFLPAIVLRFLSARRAKKFERQLPDVLTLVASSLSTGFSLPQALDAVAKDAAEPAAKEFSRALAETRIGADISDSLDRLSARMDSANMRWTTMAIRIQREVGGNLADTMRTTAKTLREREELHRHVRGLSAEGRLSAYILVGLPIGIFLYEMKVNREYIELLWTRPIGLVMLVAGVLLIGMGIAWMRKVVDVRV
jgi:tight adherence protein B